MKHKLTIRIDTREQKSLDFAEYSDYVDVTTGTVPVGDYAIEGDQDRFAVERKSLADFVASFALSKNRIREDAKIAKAQNRNGLPVVYVIEATFGDIQTFNYRRFTSGKITPQYLYKLWSEYSMNKKIHFVFCGTPQLTSASIVCLLKRRQEMIDLELI